MHADATDGAVSSQRDLNECWRQVFEPHMGNEYLLHWYARQYHRCNCSKALKEVRTVR
jgi:hypothetical protein